MGGWECRKRSHLSQPTTDQPLKSHPAAPRTFLRCLFLIVTFFPHKIPQLSSSSNIALCPIVGFFAPISKPSQILAATTPPATTLGTNSPRICSSSHRSRRPSPLVPAFRSCLVRHKAQEPEAQDNKTLSPFPEEFDSVAPSIRLPLSERLSEQPQPCVTRRGRCCSSLRQA